MTNPTRGVQLGIAAVLLTCVALMSAWVGQPVPPKATGPEVAFFIYRHEGMSTEPGGLLIAAWDDGLLVFPEDRTKAGRKQRAARVDAAKVRAMVEELKAVGFFEEGYRGRLPPPDGSAIIMSATSGAQTVQFQRDTLLAEHFESIDTDRSRKKFERVWAASYAVLRFSEPAKSVPLFEDEEAMKRYQKARSLRKVPG
jgi:hypothetical protein